MSINKIRSWLYLAARLLGDAQAIRKGPAALTKRTERRLAGRVAGKLLRGLFK